MKKGFIFSGLAVVLALFIFAPHAGAQMTSPFLVGEWEMIRTISDYYDTGSITTTGWKKLEIPMQTQFKVVNPTTTAIDVYIILYDRDGNIDYDGEDPMCYKRTLYPNQDWKSCWPYLDCKDNLIYPYEEHHYGAAKIFAFPQNTLKYDPNTVMAGFQQKSAYTVVEDQIQSVGMEIPLVAVTINSKTIGEFGRPPFAACKTWKTWWDCARNGVETAK
jgi:hypothetical protein